LKNTFAVHAEEGWLGGSPNHYGFEKAITPVDFTKGICQYTSPDGVKFFPSGSTSPELVPGIYDIGACPQRGIYFEKIPVKTDGLIHFPETNSENVIQEIEKFWNREEVFAKYRLNYKRGIMLWGPPGSGKSCTIQMVNQGVIARHGVVFKFTIPSVFCEGVRAFRKIQPKTPLVVLMEDIDSIIECYNESEVLNILDGVDQIEKVVYLATTNYPEKLGQRILNRPSRFDKRFKMGHPSDESRRIYFEHLIDKDAIEQYKIDINQWVEDTDLMSIAHLKELFVSVCILGNSYEDAIDTLRVMVEEVIDSKEDYTKDIGFHHASASSKKARRTYKR
jgi:SpoVK/Ycf46/Vps4 family AAA+-type ATPase